MRFGIQTAQLGVGTGELLDIWRFLDDETRFAGVWLMDHLIPPLRGRVLDAPCLEAWTLLAAASQVTRRLRLGCLVSANTFRHPALLAKMAVTLDQLSAGRLELGIGAGWFEEEHRAFGLPLPPLAERLDRLEEAAALLRAVLGAEGPVSFAGEHYRLEAAPFAPGFVQRPHPPLLVGGSGERRTLAIVARHADVANVQGPVSVVRRKLDALRGHCERVGRAWDAIEKTVHMPVAIVEDAAELARTRAFLVDHFGMSEQQAREEVPVGGADHVHEVLGRYAALGVAAFVLPAPGPWDRERLRRLDERVVRPLAQAA